MLPAFFIENQTALLFYAGLITLIVIFRSKLEWQAFGIGLYKTKVGLKLMNHWGTKYRKLVKFLGYVGIVAGFAGMGFIMWVLCSGFWKMLFDAMAPPVLSPVVPGFKIMGHDLKIPLVTGWLALFVVIVIHEFSHGVVSIAHKIKVKSSGLLVFGPIAGAFVEPDEKKLQKKEQSAQYSLFAAGPWSNMLSAILFILFSAFVLVPVISGMTVPGGVEIVTVTPDYPADGVLVPGMLILGVNGEETLSYRQLGAALENVGPGETLTIETDKGERSLITTENPDDLEKGYMGITLQSNTVPKREGTLYAMLIRVATWFNDFIYWIILLSLGIGLANLLPIGPVDGGRMLQGAARQIAGDEKRGDWWWKKISLIVLILVVVLLLFPIVRAFI